MIDEAHDDVMRRAWCARWCVGSGLIDDDDDAVSVSTHPPRGTINVLTTRQQFDARCPSPSAHATLSHTIRQRTVID